MRDAASLTVQLPADVTERLVRLAATAHRSVSELAAEAITHYVAYEADVVAGIERGLADMAAGRLVPHNEAMAQLEATIAAVEFESQVKRPVLWSEQALHELDDAIAYITARNPAAARKVLVRIKDAGARLGTAAIGRPGRVAGTHEKPVIGLPYIIAYAHGRSPDGSDLVVILRIIHTARDWPAGGWPA